MKPQKHVPSGHLQQSAGRATVRAVPHCIWGRQQKVVKQQLKPAYVPADLCSLCPRDQGLANVASVEAAWCLDVIPVFLGERVSSA